MNKNIQNKTNFVYFAGGCFWCTEAIFQELNGVVSVVSGYAGGATNNPTYYDVARGKSGHAECVRMEFDPKIISYNILLEVFLTSHDPTQKDGQGHDIGPQYRSIIFFTNGAEEASAREQIKKMETQRVFENKIVTQVLPLREFFEAEEDHQDYYKKNSENSYCQVVINPKLSKLRAMHAKLLKQK